MGNLYLKNKNQKDETTSPWSLKEAILIRMWEVVWTLFVRWLPKITYRWHLLLLKLFGCKVIGIPYVAPSCRIYAPWLLTLNDRCALGSRSEIYNLGPVTIGQKTTIAQYAYLCNGTHDFSEKKMPLMVGNMKIGDEVFIGAKAIILPGLNIGNRCIVGAGSVLTKSIDNDEIWAGNPAKFIKIRQKEDDEATI